jgi:fructose-bisphosphate aldolase class 1
MYDETIGQKTEKGQPFPVHLAEKGILTGIKVSAKRGRL